MKVKNKIQKIIEKYNQMPIALKASFFIILTGILKDAVDVLSTPIFTRLLSTEEYGLFSVYNSWYQIIRIVVSLYIFGDGFTVGLSRFGEDRERYSSSLQGLATSLFIIWALVVAVFRNKLESIFGIEWPYIALMLFQVLFTTSFNSWQNKKKYLYEYKKLTAVVVCYTILQPALGVVLILLNQSGDNNGGIRICSGVSVQIIFGLIIYVIQFIKKPVYFDKKYWTFSLKTNIVLIPHYMSQVILNQSDKIMIDYFVGKAQTAIYSVAHSAAFALSAITVNLNSVFVPWLYEKLNRKSTNGIKEMTSFLLLFSLVGTSVLVLVAPELMYMFAGAAYQEGKWVIPSLTVSVFFVSLYTLFTNVELYYGKNAFVMYISVIGGISNILLNYLMIPRFGYFAAGYTTLLGYMLMVGGHYVCTRKLCRDQNIDFNELYDLPKLVLIGVAALFIGIISMILYKWIVVRYIVLVIEFVGLFLNRNKFIGFYRNIKK